MRSYAPHRVLDQSPAPNLLEGDDTECRWLPMKYPQRFTFPGQGEFRELEAFASGSGLTVILLGRSL